MTPQPQQEQVVYSKLISVPSKVFPSIKKRCLALNDIGDNDDGFTRIPFELQDGDIIQVIRSRPHTSTANLHKCVHKEIRNDVEFCHYHDSPIDPTAIRKAERENCIKILAGKFLQEVYPHGIPKFVDTEHDTMIPSIGIDVLSDMIESLRSEP